MPTIYLIHGWFASKSSMTNIGNELRSRGYNVVYVEYDSGLSYSKMQKEVEREINVRPGDIVIGHSMGGIIANDLYGNSNQVIALNSPLLNKKPNTILALNWNDPITLVSAFEADYIGAEGHDPTATFALLEGEFGDQDFDNWMDPRLRNL